MARSDTTTTDGYVDIYLLPIPARNVAAYQEQASLFGAITCPPPGTCRRLTGCAPKSSIPA